MFDEAGGIVGATSQYIVCLYCEMTLKNSTFSMSFFWCLMLFTNLTPLQLHCHHFAGTATAPLSRYCCYCLLIVVGFGKLQGLDSYGTNFL